MEKRVEISLGRFLAIVAAAGAVMFVVVGYFAVREGREDQARLAAEQRADAEAKAVADAYWGSPASSPKK